MVIISPILERDLNGFLWNTAVVIDGNGQVLGISRKNHIPISGKYSETYYYNPSQLGVPVFQVKYVLKNFVNLTTQCLTSFFNFNSNTINTFFLPTLLIQTKYGRIGISMCYDRHHPHNWFMHNLNTAQIVFNPCASVGTFGEHLWPIEGRCAAAANKFYVANINRIGTESFSTGDQAGPFFGSSYVAGPNGERTKVFYNIFFISLVNTINSLTD